MGQSVRERRDLTLAIAFLALVITRIA